MQTDYIIVGGGSAGCVLANRLSENPNVHVTLVEAGGEDWNPLIHIPAGYIKTMVNPKVNWMFDTAPDARTADRKIAMPRGKVLGGSSAINAMLYVRGQAEDYDAWAARGNAGWSYLEVLPYFKKSENCQIASLQEPKDMQFRGADGPLKVNAIRSTYPILDRLMESAQSLQFPINADYNGQTQEGFGYYQLTQSHGLRFSAKKAYLTSDPVGR
ncbi:GMC family oxidoreductase N-terminal domain-containing protein [Planktomarina temperata]|nr:GMC family oxidoreductase N-terminal domain-containing protein [Planktomarina temperata]